MVMYHCVLPDRIFLNHTFFLQTYGVKAQLTSLQGSVINSRMPTLVLVDGGISSLINSV